MGCAGLPGCHAALEPMGVLSSSSLTSIPMLGRRWFPLSSGPASLSMAAGRSRPKWVIARALLCRALVFRLARLQEAPRAARPGWDNRVLDEMRHNIHARLRDYWDAGIRGPTSSGRRPARRWKRTANIRSSRRPTSRASSWMSPTSWRRPPLGRRFRRRAGADRRPATSPTRPVSTTSRPTTSSTATTSAWTTPRSGPASSTPSRATCPTPTWPTAMRSFSALADCPPPLRTPRTKTPRTGTIRP